MTTTTTIPELRADATTDEIDAAFDDAGAVIVRDAIAPHELSCLRHDLHPWIGSTPPGSRSRDPEWELFHGAETVRVNGLAAKSATLRRLASDSFLTDWAERRLIPSGGSIQVNDTQAIAIGPGERAQYLHRDQSGWPWFNQLLPDGPEITVIAMIAMTDFTAENGATRVVPGSHRVADDPSLFEPTASVPAEMTAGSLLLFSGKTIHGGGANTTIDQVRTALHLSYLLGWLRSEEAHPFAIPLDVAATMSPRGRRLFGFSEYDPAPSDGGRLWLVDFEDPAHVLFDESDDGTARVPTDHPLGAHTSPSDPSSTDTTGTTS